MDAIILNRYPDNKVLAIDVYPIEMKE